MNIIICDDLYLHTVRCAPIVLHPLLKGYVIHMDLVKALIGQPPFALYCWRMAHLTLKFHDLHPFLIYTPSPSVYAHIILTVWWCRHTTDTHGKTGGADTLQVHMVRLVVQTHYRSTW